MILAAAYNTLAHGGDLLEAGVMVGAMAMPVVGIAIAVVVGGRALAQKEAEEALVAADPGGNISYDATGSSVELPSTND